MNRFIKYMIFTIAFLMYADSNAQSIIKQVGGNVYQVINNVKKPIRGFNTIVNDSSTLKLDVNAFIVVEINGQISRILGEEYPNGIQLMNFKAKIEVYKPSNFLNKVITAVYNHSFNDRKKIDGLYITQFQGASRSISKNSLENRKVSANYKSKIEWSLGVIKINSGSKNLITATREDLDYIYIDEHLLNDCTPCNVNIDNNKRGLIESVILNNEDKILLEFLFSNIDSEIDVEFSQFCIIRIFIDRELFINANYYLDKFDNNKLIKDYLIYMRSKF